MGKRRIVTKKKAPILRLPCDMCRQKDELILLLQAECTKLTEERDMLKGFDLYKREAERELVKTCRDVR